MASDGTGNIEVDIKRVGVNAAAATLPLVITSTNTATPYVTNTTVEMPMNVDFPEGGRVQADFTIPEQTHTFTLTTLSTASGTDTVTVSLSPQDPATSYFVAASDTATEASSVASTASVTVTVVPRLSIAVTATAVSEDGDSVTFTVSSSNSLAVPTQDVLVKVTAPEVTQGATSFEGRVGLDFSGLTSGSNYNPASDSVQEVLIDTHDNPPLMGILGGSITTSLNTTENADGVLTLSFCQTRTQTPTPLATRLASA